ncbi:hypothetical protein BC828DRAFT_393617 [Blastocladiella britannica]|nr:hypothetical protein BC828DRAFT_393617 [Blastocladiella britannica]
MKMHIVILLLLPILALAGATVAQSSTTASSALPPSGTATPSSTLATSATNAASPSPIPPRPWSDMLSAMVALPPLPWTLQPDPTSSKLSTNGPDAVRIAWRALREAQQTVPLHRVAFPTLDSAARWIVVGSGDNATLDLTTARIDAVADPLAWGFRKLILDLYWDAGRNLWQLCPVAYPFPLDAAISKAASTSSAPSAPPAATTAAQTPTNTSLPVPRLLPGGRDVLLPVPSNVRSRTLGASLVACAAVPGDDWRRTVARIQNYVASTSAGADTMLSLVVLRTHDLSAPPQNASAPLSPPASASVAPVVSTTVVNGTTVLVTPVATSTTPPTPTSPPLDPGVTVPTPLAVQLGSAFGNALMVPADLKSRLQVLDPADPQTAPWNVSDAMYNVGRALPFPTLGSLMRISPGRALGFVIADPNFVASPPAGYNGAKADAQVLLTHDVLAGSDYGPDLPLAIPATIPSLNASSPPFATAVKSLLLPLANCGSIFGQGQIPSGNESVTVPGMPAFGGRNRVRVSFPDVEATDPGLAYDTARVLAGCGFPPHLGAVPAMLPAMSAVTNATLTLLAITDWAGAAAARAASQDAQLAAAAGATQQWLFAPGQALDNVSAACGLAVLANATTLDPNGTLAAIAASASAPPAGIGAGIVSGALVVPERCLELNNVACQSKTDPHAWSISSARYSWTDASATVLTALAPPSQAVSSTVTGGISGGVLGLTSPCPAGTFFSAPRTPMQSWSLAAAMQQAGVVSAWTLLAGRHGMGCWTVGGGECPYSVLATGAIQDLISVSVVGGLLVLVLVAVFLWMKWRRISRQSAAETREKEVMRKLKRLEYMSVPA